jgi:transaldolase/glucose-6-phosphate isomerase
MNSLGQLQQFGQSVWLDYIRRHLITSGELKRRVEEDGLRGITSNPTIFEKAISGSSDYDEAIRKALAANPGIEPGALFEKLEVEDIQLAADVLRPCTTQRAARTDLSASKFCRSGRTTRPEQSMKPNACGVKSTART